VSVHDADGGIRDRVRGFSKASRRNLLRRLASVDRGAFRNFKGRVLFATLTYPHVWPEDPEACKGHLKAFRKRLQRRYGPFAAFWRLGVQQRGAWHFHLLLFVGPSFGPLDKAAPVRVFFLARCHREAFGGAPARRHPRRGRPEVEGGDGCAERLRGQARRVPRRIPDGAEFGSMERGILPVRWETVRVDLRGRFQDQASLQKAGQEEGRRPPYAVLLCS
jgi:hypothetical protein